MDQFVDMLRTAQDGKGLENLAHVCGLSVQQAQATAEAFMPTFMNAFSDMTRSPEAMANITQMMMTGPYAAFYAAQPAAPAPQPSFPPAQGRSPYTAHGFPTSGFPPAQPTPAYAQKPAQQAPMTQAGMNALNTVFGSSDVSAAVANQVAASTGLSVAVVRQAMPAMASIVVGELAKSLAASGSLQQMLAAMLSRMPVAQGQARHTPISSGNPWMDAFMAFSSTAGGASPYGTKNPWMSGGMGWGQSNPWADAMSHGMRLATPPQPAPQPSAPASWQDVVNAMTNTMAQTGAAMNGPSTPQPPASPAASTPTPAPSSTSAPATQMPPNPFAEFQDMFARMMMSNFRQGAQPAYQPPLPEQPPISPATEGQSAPLSPLDFWMEIMKQAHENSQKALANTAQRTGGKPEKSGKKSDK